MNLYKNLSDEVKPILIFRLCYISILFTINIFIIIILSAFNNTWIIIPIIVCNCLAILNSLWHTWSMIYYNRIWTDNDLSHCYFSGVFDIVPIFIIEACSLTYISIISSNNPVNKIPLYWYELLIIIIYLIPLTILVLWIIGAIIIHIIMCGFSTISVVNDRNENNNYKKIIKDDKLENVEISSFDDNPIF